MYPLLHLFYLGYKISALEKPHSEEWDPLQGYFLLSKYFLIASAINVASTPDTTDNAKLNMLERFLLSSAYCERGT